MRNKHAADIRKGVERAMLTDTTTTYILNSRNYSRLAVYAFNTYRMRHWRELRAKDFERTGRSYSS